MPIHQPTFSRIHITIQQFIEGPFPFPIQRFCKNVEVAHSLPLTQSQQHFPKYLQRITLTLPCSHFPNPTQSQTNHAPILLANLAIEIEEFLATLHFLDVSIHEIILDKKISFLTYLNPNLNLHLNKIFYPICFTLSKYPLIKNIFHKYIFDPKIYIFMAIKVGQIGFDFKSNPSNAKSHVLNLTLSLYYGLGYMAYGHK
jgi:hypothetical protein